MKFKSVLISICFLVVMLFSYQPLLTAQYTQDKPANYYFSLPSEPGEVIESEDLRFYLDTVVEGLDSPWGMVFLPDGSMLITEKSGTLRVVENGSLLDETVLGVPDVFDRNQGGLLDIALHPDFEENRYVYLAYSIPTGNEAHTAIGRGVYNDYVLENFEVLFEGSPKTRRPFHFGSRIVFDNDGYMYFAIGDRGEMETAQDLTNHSGKTFRLYDDGTVPEDNPFVHEDGAMPEIFTLGNRNIQGMTLHPGTGEVWSNEHGPRGGDEINIIRPGLNYGWPEITHGIDYAGSEITPDTAAPGMEQPLHHWTPSIAPSGMAIIYNSDRYENWNGDVFNGALAQRHLNRIVVDENHEHAVKEERLLQGIARIRDVRFAPDGFLYIMEESNGRIIRLIPENFEH